MGPGTKGSLDLFFNKRPKAGGAGVAEDQKLVHDALGSVAGLSPLTPKEGSPVKREENKEGMAQEQPGENEKDFGEVERAKKLKLETAMKGDADDPIVL